MPSLQLEVCRNIELFCCNQVNSLSQHQFSRLCFFVRTRNLVFQCRDIHYLIATELLHTVLRHRLPCHERGLSSAYSLCFNRLFQVAIVSVTIEEYSITGFFLCCSLISCYETKYLIETEFLLSSCFQCRDRSFYVATSSSWC